MNKQLVVAMVSIAMIASSCVSTPKSEYRNIASTPEVDAIAAQGKDYQFSYNERARRFTSEDVAKLASASNIKLIAGQVMTSNDQAFDQKLRLIDAAQVEIRMVYFIYSNDDSSSKINSALIAKAQGGVKVKLMVDFVTNYQNLDLFSMLEREGKGNITTYFYNVPTSQIIQDANYTVLPCPKDVKPESDACFNSKKAALDAMSNKQAPSSFAKILLAGMYGKNATAIKVALGYGAEIDPKNYQAAKEKAGSVEDRDAMLNFAQLVSEAVIQNSLIAKIKLSLLMMTNGDTYNPIINEITGRLPVRSLTKNAEHGKLWDHMTDYTHHKLIAIDGNQFQLGGRNVEDSYHMNQRPADSKTGKYIFVDTDFWGQTAAGGTRGIEAAFDRITETKMVSKLAVVKAIMSYEFIANTSGSSVAPGASETAVGYCLQQKAADLGGCILQALPSMPGYKSEDSRLNASYDSMKQSIDTYDRDYVAKGLKKDVAQFPRLSEKDLATAEVSYLENLAYQKGTLTRVIGSKIGSEAENNKNIQATWYRDLENACKVSRDEKRDMRVIFHSAYLLMPSGMVHRIAKMMNNDYGDCSRVHITFITNSTLTTDLSSINILARYQLGALFTHYLGLVNYKKRFEEGGFKYKQFFPRIDYYELKANSGVNESLHTKTSLIGDDLIVGSANADVRSYFMDTNNAVLIRNAKEMNAQYITFVDGLISSVRVEEKMSEFVGKTTAALRTENEYMLNASAKRWHQEKRLTPERVTAILNYLDEAGKRIYEATNKLILFRNVLENGRMQSENGSGSDYQTNKELNDIANGYDAMFKVF